MSIHNVSAISLLIFVFLSSELTSQWKNTNGPRSLSNFYGLTAVDSNYYCATRAEGVFYSSDYGISWKTANSGLPMATYCIASHQDVSKGVAYIYVGAEGTGFYRSSNLGGNWVNMGVTTKTIMDIQIVDSCVYIATDNGVLVSADYGLTFKNALSDNVDIRCSAIAVADSCIYAGTYDGYVYRYARNGTKVLQQTSRLASDMVIGLTPFGKKLYATSWQSRPFHSDDSGATWSFVNGMPGKIVTKTVVAHGIVYQLTQGAGIYRSTDSGSTWRSFNEGFTDTYNQCETMLLANEKLLVGNNGYIWHRLANEPTNVDDNIGYDVHTEDVVLAVFPSIASVNCEVVVTLPVSQKIVLKLYDLQGGTPQIVYDGYLPSGTKRIPLEVVDLPSGSYYLSLLLGTSSHTSRFIVSH